MLVSVCTLALSFLLVELKNSDDLVEFRTAIQTYKIPSPFVVPGSLFNEPLLKNSDLDGPSVDLFFGGWLTEEQVNVSKSIEDVLLLEGLHVTLTDTKKFGKEKLWSDVTKSEPIMLSGEFINGTFEYSKKLDLYRVFRQIEGKKDVERWDLVTIKPSVDQDDKGHYDGLWVASCFQNLSDLTVECYYEIEILGLYSVVTGSEISYLKLNNIETTIASYLSHWK